MTKGRADGEKDELTTEKVDKGELTTEKVEKDEVTTEKVEKDELTAEKVENDEKNHFCGGQFYQELPGSADEVEGCFRISDELGAIHEAMKQAEAEGHTTHTFLGAKTGREDDAAAVTSLAVYSAGQRRRGPRGKGEQPPSRRTSFFRKPWGKGAPSSLRTGGPP